MIDGAGGGIYPRHSNELMNLTEEQLEQLEGFYSMEFQDGYGLQGRRQAFAYFIGKIV